MEEAKIIFKHLDDLKPYQASQNRDPFERKIGHISTYCLGASILFFLILCSMAFSTVITNNVMPIVAFLGKFSGALSTTLALTSIALPILYLPFLIIKRKTIFYNDFMQEIEHDESNIAFMQSHQVETLKYAKTWLETKTNRMERRINSFFGPNTAAVAIVALTLQIADSTNGWNIAFNTFKNGASLDNLGGFLYTAAFGAILGISLGSLATKALIMKYQYQLDLVNICINRKS